MQSRWSDEAAATEVVIDGVLDLHTFRPDEVKRLIPEYIRLCREQGIHELRIIHGKGKGVLRRLVHAALEREAAVLSFRLAGADGGSWGATLVDLRPAATTAERP
ncbi:MAG: DNA mismatch repair protein MutS [Desulfobulbaceae bacterium]|nr:MAG: DNA mismatch repair protein MutS [Desulfobulbaceae bacterium]